MKNCAIRWDAVIILAVALFMSHRDAAASPDSTAFFYLWANGAPGALGDAEADKPSMTVYLPAGGGTGTGVVVLPGGGYGHLAVDHEGRQVAEWLNSLGIAAFVVRYRHAPGYAHPTPLRDAQRAIRTVRARAGEWGVDPAKVGIIGFSAGGHLASSTGVHFDWDDEIKTDAIDTQSARPDFMILVYPVITMIEPMTHRGSRRNLLGEDPDPALVAEMSSEWQVTAETPPTFLMHTTTDTAVPVENSLAFYEALRRAGVPAEMHVYAKGPHGFGLAPNDPILATWPARCADWLRLMGF
ncbi:MAG: alpha/beta hydrolase [Rhodothermales bacterium]